ncbi:MAG: CapA family protein [Treponema sp.]|jgi:poly-gamma-glutamate synthesis protein (capsule biosynthesis protein)|nr:CapA family protein [Treponema sp.]
MKTPYLFVFLGIILFGSCKAQTDLLVLNGGDKFAREQDFLTSFFEESGLPESLGFRPGSGLSGEDPEGRGDSGIPKRNRERPDIVVDFFSSWEFEHNFGDILLSKTWYVPREDALAGRKTTDIAACLEGREFLVALPELEPPFIALRVDGKSVDDEAYPLIRAAGIRIQARKPSPEDFPGGPLRKKIITKKIEKAYAEVLPKIQALEEALRAADKPLIQSSPDILWIASGGDLMLGRGAADILFAEGPVGIFGGTVEFLAQADLTLVNLEGAVSSRGTKVAKSFNFRFDPRIAPALRDAGINGVLLANNHAFDYGEDAFLDSLAWLGEAGIAVLGAGIDEKNAARPFLFQKGAQTVRTFGIASFPREKNGWDGLMAAAGEEKAGLLHARRGGGEKLKALFSQNAFENSPLSLDSSPEPIDVVLFHGGIEWAARPDTFTREFYTDLVQNGVDLVIGSHPHMVQGFEWILGKPVFWSLGNYVFGGMENTGGGDEGLFIHLGFSGGRLVYLEPFALKLSHVRTTIAPAENLSRFYTLSRQLRDAASPELMLQKK